MGGPRPDRLETKFMPLTGPAKTRQTCGARPDSLKAKYMPLTGSKQKNMPKPKNNKKSGGKKTGKKKAQRKSKKKTQAKPSTCGYCQTDFTSKRQLKKHERYDHFLERRATKKPKAAVTGP